MRASIDVGSKFLAQPVSTRRITSGFRQLFPYREAVKESNSALSSVMVQAH
jgi:hypothetical protein